MLSVWRCLNCILEKKQNAGICKTVSFAAMLHVTRPVLRAWSLPGSLGAFGSIMRLMRQLVCPGKVPVPTVRPPVKLFV